MKQKIFSTIKGNIHYWINEKKEKEITLVFLPGLTADHRLFIKQVKYFKKNFHILIWDAPGHGKSRPFELSFSIMDKACWLHEILYKEGIEKVILIGQSMGGYVGQAFAEQYPDALVGFISIDSAPLLRKYITSAELWLLKRMEPVYKIFPWKILLKSGIKGTSFSEYGRKLIYKIWLDYEKKDFCRLASYGYNILAEAIEANLKYEIKCPALLICGENDQAGSVKRYNRKWTKQTGIPLVWIPKAGHNSNVDNPDIVNLEIENFVKNILETI